MQAVTCDCEAGILITGTLAHSLKHSHGTSEENAQEFEFVNENLVNAREMSVGCSTFISFELCLTVAVTKDTETDAMLGIQQ